MKLFNDIYQGKKVLVTGDTGFKGSWLTYWLQTLGAEVIGLSVDVPTSPSLHKLLDLNYQKFSSDIRDSVAIEKIVKECKPDIIFHLAAQALVRPSYLEPRYTFEVNVMGTVNVLEATRRSSTVEACVIVTSDKCYENRNTVHGYIESDKLGGRDPYSASKGCAEIVTSSYRQSFFENSGVLVASVRAGNVIGGGDWSEDRLIPDIMRAVTERKPLQLRNPQATRPWQHVLDPLSGYLLLGEQLLKGVRDHATSYNFGPSSNSGIAVEELVKQVKLAWNTLSVEYSGDEQPHEAALLHLDSTKALNSLHWQSTWDLEKAIQRTIQWYDSNLKGEAQAANLCQDDLSAFLDEAKQKEHLWIRS